MNVNSFDKSSTPAGNFRRSQSFEDPAMSEFHLNMDHSLLSSSPAMNPTVENFYCSNNFTDSPILNFESDYEVDFNEEVVEVSSSAHNYEDNLSFHPNYLTDEHEMEASVLTSNKTGKYSYSSKPAFSKLYNDEASMPSLYNPKKQGGTSNFLKNLLGSEEMRRSENVRYECISTILNSDTRFKEVKFPISSSDAHEKHNNYPFSNSYEDYVLDDHVMPVTGKLYPASDRIKIPHLSSHYPASNNSQNTFNRTENLVPFISIPDTGIPEIDEDYVKDQWNPLHNQSQCVYPDKSHKNTQSYRKLSRSLEKTNNVDEPLFCMYNEDIKSQKIQHPSVPMEISRQNKNNYPPYDKTNVHSTPYSETTSYDTENPLPYMSRGSIKKTVMEDQNVCDQFKYPTMQDHIKKNTDSHFYKSNSRLTMEVSLNYSTNEAATSQVTECPSIPLKRFIKNKNIYSATYDRRHVSFPGCSETTTYDTENPLSYINDGSIKKYTLPMQASSGHQSTCSNVNVSDEYKLTTMPGHVKKSSYSSSCEARNPRPNVKKTSDTRLTKNMKRETRTDILKEALKPEQSTKPFISLKSKLDENLDGSEGPLPTSSSSSQRKNISTESEEKEDSSSSRNINNYQPVILDGSESSIPASSRIFQVKNVFTNSDENEESSSPRNLDKRQTVISIPNYISNSCDSSLSKERKTASKFEMVSNDGEKEVASIVDHTGKHETSEDSDADMVCVKIQQILY